MLDKLFSGGLDLLAFVLPISIAATNIIFFPLAAVWLFGAKWTFPSWRPVWGWPEKLFLVYLVVSLLSTAFGLDVLHSLREIKNKDFYILIAIVLVALVRDRKKNERLMSLFMTAAFLTAVWGLMQCAMRVNMTDKGEGGYFMNLPHVFAHWPRAILRLMTMINGRVLGTRGHPLSYAECLLFNWALAICFLLRSRSAREAVRWSVYMLVVGAALLVSQSRGPWIAAAAIAFLAMATSPSRRAWILFGLCALLMAAISFIPVIRDRATSILDKTHHSNSERVHMWQAGHQMWKTHPMLGIGPGNVKGMSSQYQTTDEKVWGPWGHLHSIYVNGLVERGLLGMAAFFLFLGSFWMEFWGALKKSSDDPWKASVLKGSLLGMLGFLISGTTETSYNSAVVMMTFYFVVGLALALVRHEEPSR